VLYTVIRVAVGLVFRVVWRPVVEGSERVPADGPVIVASNHLSFIDSIVLPLAVPHRRVTFLAKSDYFEGGGLLGLPRRVFFRTMGAVPVRRGEQGEAQAALETALEVLGRGWAVGVYPEGTRSRDGRLYRGRTGIGWLALAAGAPVVPVGLRGTDHVQPVGARFPRVRRVTVRFGDPIDPRDYADVEPAALARRRITDDVMSAVGELSGQERVAAYNARPPDA
jgi:1-acyl-sn-glycerol-3-phosphate acyltransferase